MIKRCLFFCIGLVGMIALLSLAMPMDAEASWDNQHGYAVSAFSIDAGRPIDGDILNVAGYEVIDPGSGSCDTAVLSLLPAVSFKAAQASGMTGGRFFGSGIKPRSPQI